MMTRMFTAAAIAALMAGSAMAQSSQVQGAEPGMKGPQNADESVANPQTGDATMSADGNQVQAGTTDSMGQGSMSDQGAMSSSMSSDQGMSSDSSMADQSSMASSGSMGSSSMGGAMTTRTVTNGPVPDTPENRAKYGKPMSNAGKRSTPAGN